jgi:hypothetical protein
VVLKQRARGLREGLEDVQQNRLLGQGPKMGHVRDSLRRLRYQHPEPITAAGRGCLRRRA